MPKVEMKNGEIKEIPDNEMRDFLNQNKERIKNRYSPRQRTKIE